MVCFMYRRGCVGEMDPAIMQQSDMLMSLHQHGGYWHEALEPQMHPGDMNHFGVHVVIT